MVCGSNSNSKPEVVIPAALAEFEEEMLQRSAVKVARSADAASFLHSDIAICEGNVTRGSVALDSHANELERRGQDKHSSDVATTNF